MDTMRFTRGFPRRSPASRPERTVVLVGDPAEGFEVYGPFEDPIDAAEELQGTDGWIVELKTPRSLPGHRGTGVRMDGRHDSGAVGWPTGSPTRELR